MNPIEIIKQKQQIWAKNNHISFDTHGYVCNLSDNLFEPLQDDTKSEFENGAGDELDGKMRALHSSSALVCNFFNYWRNKELESLSQAIGLNVRSTKIVFEKTYSKPKEIPGIKPHLDVEISCDGLIPVAIESKFTEPYTPKQYNEKHPPFKSAYLENPCIWGDLTGCRDLVQKIAADYNMFKYLDAPQLLKHILGLKTENPKYNFKLIYLWYKVESNGAQRHSLEITKFKTYIQSELDFQAITYQEVFDRLSKKGDEHKDYLNYMKNRYF